MIERQPAKRASSLSLLLLQDLMVSLHQLRIHPRNWTAANAAALCCSRFLLAAAAVIVAATPAALADAAAAAAAAYSPISYP